MTRETLLRKPVCSRKTWLIAAIVTAIALLGGLGIGAEGAYANATIPEGAVFTDVTCDVTGHITVEDTGEEVTFEGNGGPAPLYLVTVPEGASKVTVTMPKADVSRDEEGQYGSKSVNGYYYEDKAASWASMESMATFPARFDDSNAYFDIDIEKCLEEDNKQGGPEYEDFSPIFAFTFKYGEAGQDPAVNQAPSAHADFSVDMRLSQWKDFDLTEYFTDPEGDALTYSASDDGGEWKSFTSSSFRYYAPTHGEHTVALKARDTANNESDIMTITFNVEKPKDKVSVYFSVTDGFYKYFKSEKSGVVMTPTLLEVPYFDLTNYGLTKYYYNSRCYESHKEGDTPYSNAQQPGTSESAEGIVTTMHAFIYATEVLYLGYDKADAGTGKSYDEGEFQDAISWTQGAGSSFMNLWGKGTNLNYYIDFAYPLGAPEWGSTSDQQPLYGGEDISVHYLGGGGDGSSFGFITQDGENDPTSYVREATVDKGEKITFTAVESQNNANYVTSYSTLNGAAVVWCPESDFSEDLRDWEKDPLGNDSSTDTEDGEFTIDTKDVAPGVYYVGIHNKGNSELGPMYIKLTVTGPPFTIEGVDGNYKVTTGDPVSLDGSKPHYVIHLTEEDVSGAKWSIVDSNTKATVYWPGTLEWTMSAMRLVNPSPQAIRKNNENALFAALQVALPPSPQIIQAFLAQGKVKENVNYYYTVVADYQIPVHDHEWGDPSYEWAKDKSKCTGSVKCTFSGCKESITEEATISSEIVTQATCSKEGGKKYTATFTNDHFTNQTETEPIAKTAHTPGDVQIENETQADCENAGGRDKVVYCTVCEEQISRVHETDTALGHQWGEWEKVDDDKHKRTCGRVEGHVAEEAHTWNAGVETKPASQTEEGEKSFECTKCGATKTEPIPKLPKTDWEIGTAEELVEFATTAPANAKAVLTADIDMDGVDWTPMATFSGSFDGQHHTIKNLSGTNGLFAKVAGASASNRAEVKNVTVEGTISGSGDVGGIAGQAYYATFYNCINKANIQSGSNVGGIVGKAQRTMGEGSVSFTNCGNEGTIKGSDCTGGIFGYGQSQIDLESCYNKGDITGLGASESTKGTGGIGGFVQGYRTACAMNNIYNNGAVSGKQAVGGLIGSMRNGVTITNGYTSGAITGTSKVGAIAGSVYNATAKATNVYYLEGSCTQAAQGNNFSGIVATSKTDEELKADAMVGLLGGAFKATDDYPILIWESYTPGAKIYEVTPPDTAGVGFSGAQTASSEEPYSFKITVNKYHKATEEFAVKINGEKVEPESNEGQEYSYVVAEPNCDMVITVEGVESTKEAIWTGSQGNWLPSPGSYVKSINIYNVEIEEKVVNGTNVDVVLKEGTDPSMVIPFIVEVGGHGAPTVIPGTAFEKKLAGGKLVQKIQGKDTVGHETTWTINITVRNAPEAETVDVHKPESNMFSITGFDKAVVGSDYTFTVDIDSRHGPTEDFQVRVNGEVIEAENDEYTVKNVQEPLTIAVDGVAILTFDHIDAVTPDGTKTVVDDHTVVLKGKYTVEMQSGDSGWDPYPGVPYYHVVVPYGTEKVKIAYPSYVWSSTHGQNPNEFPPGDNFWTTSTVNVNNNVPQRGNGQNGGVTAYTIENGFKVFELKVSDYLVKANGNGRGFSPIGRTGAGHPGFYGVISFQVADHEHQLKKTDEIPATCTVDGTEAYWTCEIETCKKMFSDENATNEIAGPVAIKAGHDWEEKYTTDKDPTCAEEGSKSKHCKNCDEKRDVTSIQKLPHKLTHNAACPVTCEGDGCYENWECSECKKHFRDEEGKCEMDNDSWIIGATGHDWSDWELTKKPTEKTEGEETRHCKNDGCEKTETRSVSKLKPEGGGQSGSVAKPAKPVLRTQGSVKNKLFNTSWKKVANGKTYRLEYRKAGGSWKSVNAGTKTSFRVKNLKMGGLYEIRAVAYNGKIKGKYSNISRRYLRYVTGVKYKAKKKQIVVSWKKDKKATGYQILYATNKKMKNAKIIDLGKSRKSYTIKGLKKGKAYYVCIRPIKEYKGNKYKGVLTLEKKVRVK